MLRFASALLLSCCTLVSTARAADLQPFQLDYSAHYGRLAATASRSLQPQPGGRGWQLRSSVALKVFGNLGSNIEETSDFAWEQNQPVSQRHSFVQKGIGRRSRSVQFADDGRHATYSNDDDKGVLALVGPTFDNLNSQLVLHNQVEAGATDIHFAVADRGELTSHHYRVIGKETIATAAGDFATVHVQRIRATGDERQTEFWLASDYAYVLVKLLQSEPDGATITLELLTGSVAGKTLAAAAPLP
jgi:Protein of unknown function (DUF3108)